jgi:hypothetical protein
MSRLRNVLAVIFSQKKKKINLSRQYIAIISTKVWVIQIVFCVTVMSLDINPVMSLDINQ